MHFPRLLTPVALLQNRLELVRTSYSRTGKVMARTSCDAMTSYHTTDTVYRYSIPDAIYSIPHSSNLNRKQWSFENVTPLL